MTWDGTDRRTGKDRRECERRRTMRYNVQTLLVIDGITWIDAEGGERRQSIRREQDRLSLAKRIVLYARP